MARPIVPGAKCRAYVQDRSEFLNNTYNLRGIRNFGDRYVVMSYDQPIFVYDDGRWFEVNEKFSTTTSKHQTQAHPHCETQKVSAVDILSVAHMGVAKAVASKLRQAAEVN